MTSGSYRCPQGGSISLPNSLVQTGQYAFIVRCQVLDLRRPITCNGWGASGCGIQHSPGAHPYVFPIGTCIGVLDYGRSEILPSISPVSVKSAGAFKALRNTDVIVAV